MGHNQLATTEVLESVPVFVDRTGRRRRLARNAGIAVGCLLVAYLAIVAFGLVSGADVPMTPWPAPKTSHRAVPPRHGESAVRERNASRPAVRPTPSGTLPSRGAQAPSSPSTKAPTTAPTSAPTTAPAAAPTAQPSQAHAYGHTKSPNPRKP